MYEIPALTRWDTLLFYCDSYVRQLLVVPFLLYSGYGVTLAIYKKGSAYADYIPVRRVLPTLINYDIAILFFIAMNLFMGFELDLKKILLAFTGWESIRNSNWYIFCILICYIISWLSYRVSFGCKRRMIVYVWCGIILYTAILYFFKGHWWYDTVYAYDLYILACLVITVVIAYYYRSYEKVCNVVKLDLCRKKI